MGFYQALLILGWLKKGVNSDEEGKTSPGELFPSSISLVHKAQTLMIKMQFQRVLFLQTKESRA